jgi:xylulokinase
MRQVTAQVDSRRIAALSISHQRETFVPVDGNMHPLRKAIVWLDKRGRDLLPALADRIGAERFHRLTGKPLSINLSVSKIAWLREHEPEVFSATRWYLDTHAFLVHRLTGEIRTGWGSADPTGLFDLPGKRWAEPVLEAIGVRNEQLPELYPPGAPIGAVSRAAAAQTGLMPGLPVICGLGDGQAAGLGAGITAEGRAYLSLGTSVVSGTHADAYVADPAFRTLCSGIAESYLLETALLGGAFTIAWFAEKIAPDMAHPGASVEEVFEAACAELPPGAEGLMLVPYWNSATNPYWDAAASGIVVGWRGIHDRRHFYRAILEGIAFEQRLYIEGIEAATGRPVGSFVAMGGGSRSALWLQIIADVTGKPVLRCAGSEASALGAAMLAAAGVGLYAGPREAAVAMSRTEPDLVLPDTGRHEVYSRLYEEVYRGLFPALQPGLRRLSELT